MAMIGLGGAEAIKVIMLRLGLLVLLCSGAINNLNFILIRKQEK
jgi:hypothetical protein